jgi:CheY-like chemotaxis protein/two-component sensor histidine kinase
MLAHELRNPLASIGNAAALLGSAASESQRTWATGVIERQVLHLSRLLDDLLDVSRITRGLTVLEKERLDVRRAVEDAVESTRPIVEERGHRLEVSLPSEPVWVDADSARLEQILTNLLTNAARYTGTGGRIRVRAARESGEAVIEVEDTGQGIPAAELPGIFDLFSRGHHPGRADGGLGLGLTVVKSLTELHGGEVSAVSEGEGKGSRFVVRLPLSSGPSSRIREALPKEPSVGSPDGGTRILVVDDNVDAADAMKCWLELEGHVVVVAYDGASALQEAERFAPRVVLLDLGLPGMDGYEVAAELRRRKFSADATLVAVTGYGQDRDRERARDVGILHYCVKPVDRDDLRVLIRAAVARPDGSAGARSVR